MRPFIGWSATVVITLGRSRMGSSCPLLSSPTGNDPAFPKLALFAHSHTGGLGASFGSAITESLLPEKAIHLSRNTVPPGSNCYRLRRGKAFPIWKPLNLQRIFFLENLVLPEKKFLKTSPPYSVNQLPFLSQCCALSLYNGQLFCELGGAASGKFPFLLFNGQKSAVC